jgi:hypothetical protein
MARSNDGGPAFPQPDAYFKDGSVALGQFGMSLRDYFAAKVLQGFAADPSLSGPSGPSTREIAARAYSVADAMLAERERQS